MPSKHDPVDCLADINNAARIAGYIQGMDQRAFEQNGLVWDAAERCVERICEATVRLGSDAERLMPGRTSAAWEIGCGTHTIGSAWKRYG